MLQSFLSLCLAADLNGPVSQKQFHDYRSDTGPQVGEWGELFGRLECHEAMFDVDVSHFKILMYEMFWVRKGKLSDVARSFKAGLHLVVQPQCMCYLAMSNLILTTKMKQGFEVQNFPAFWDDIDLLYIMDAFKRGPRWTCNGHWQQQFQYTPGTGVRDNMSRWGCGCDNPGDLRGC